MKLEPRRTRGSTLRERMTENAYERILPARYLSKGETQEELFERVAKNIALAELAYLDEEFFVRPQHIKDHPRSHELIQEVFSEQNKEVAVTERNIKHFSYDKIAADLELPEQVTKARERFQEAMEQLDFMPNSPTLMNAGDELQQLSACFVDSPADDMEDIHQTLKEAAMVFQSGGGMGYSFSELRPYGDKVGSTDGIASGPITFMREFDVMCETIAQGGARRGAQMAVMSITHPDVIDFIHSKNKDVSLAVSLRLNDPDDYTYNTFGEALAEARQILDERDGIPKHLRNAVEGHLSNFNISVGITDDFMEAKKNGEDFTFINPRTGEPHIATEETKEVWKRYDLKSFVEVGEPLEIPAELVWDHIVEGAYENGEPGVVFLDRINQEHSFDTEKYPDHKIKATNPCGEQPLEEYEACNLGHINLSTLVTDEQTLWDDWFDGDELTKVKVADFIDENVRIGELEHRVEVGTRFLDNVVTMSDFPVPEIEKKVRENRKIGLGIMGLAQLYTQLGVRYGSDVGNLIAENLMRRINYMSKDVSHELAKERGTFDNFRESKYYEPTEYGKWFSKYTGYDPDKWPDGFPVRNHNTTTIAPTGTTSMVANTTGGCEPIFNVAHFKNVSDDVQGDEMLVEFDDYFLQVLDDNDIDTEEVKREATEQMQNNQFEGVSSLSTVPDEIGELFVTTDQISAKEHAAVQCALQKGVDSAISKTCNFPNSATKNDMREVYDYIYDNGGKGVTVYRDGTRSKQVLTTRADNKVDEIPFPKEWDLMSQLKKAESEQEVRDIINRHGQAGVYEGKGAIEGERKQKRERPDMLSGTTQRITTGYGKLYVNINNFDGAPFELIANIGDSGGFMNGMTEALGKTISVALRHGVPPEELAEHLVGIKSPNIAWDNQEQINSIPDAVGKALERHITDVNPGGYTPKTTAQASEHKTDGGTTSQKSSGSDSVTSSSTGEPCPDCGALLSMQEGCKTCESCGFSHC